VHRSSIVVDLSFIFLLFHHLSNPSSLIFSLLITLLKLGEPALVRSYRIAFFIKKSSAAY